MMKILPKLLVLWLLIGIISTAVAQTVVIEPQAQHIQEPQITVIEVEPTDAQSDSEQTTKSEQATAEQAIAEQEDKEQSYWELEVGGAFMLGRHAMGSLNDNETGFYSITPWLAGGYYNGNFFIESDPGNAKPLTIGYTGYESEKLQVNLVGMPFFFGFDEEVQVQGDLLSGLDTREASFEVGIEALTSVEFGQLGFRVLTDISEVHSGTVVDFVYGYPLYFDKTVVWPSFGLTYVTEEANDYYYGIRPHEARPDRPFYQAGSGVVAKLNLYFEHELSETNSIIGFSQLNVLNSAIIDSPIIEHSYSFTIGVGYIWIY